MIYRCPPVFLAMAALGGACARATLWLARRRGELLAMRDALYVTLRQFDPALDPTTIGATEEWLKPFGRGMAGRRRYEAALRAVC